MKANSEYDLVEPYDDKYAKVKQATQQGFILCEWGGVADLSFPSSKTRRGRVEDNGQIYPTIMSSGSNIYRIERE